jgi:Enoyl-CoA hydratase/isomerase
VPTDVIAAAAFARAVRDPEWLEAPLTDAISPLTAIDLEDDLTVDVPRAASRLFVGVRRVDHAAAPSLDAVVSSDEELHALSDACEQSPRAVIALAQLLRSTEHLDVGSALLAESFAYSTLLTGEEFQRWQRARPVGAHRAAATPLHIEDDGATLTVTLNRPEVRNAYDAAMRDALVDVLRSACAMEPSRAVALRGNGASFCSGGDLTEFGTSDDAARAHLVRVARAPGMLLHQLRGRTTAYVHGACVGAGTELPAFCTHVSAHPDTTFRLPEIAMGLVPGAGGTVSVSRRIGRQRTCLFAVTGTALTAPVARCWGLVDGVST